MPESSATKSERLNSCNLISFKWTLKEVPSSKFKKREKETQIREHELSIQIIKYDVKCSICQCLCIIKKTTNTTSEIFIQKMYSDFSGFTLNPCQVEKTVVKSSKSGNTKQISFEGFSKHLLACNELKMSFSMQVHFNAEHCFIYYIIHFFKLIFSRQNKVLYYIAASLLGMKIEGTIQEGRYTVPKWRISKS